MTKDEIFQIAQQCFPSDRRMWSVDADLPALERFAALVAEKEREACAKVCENEWNEYCDEPSGYALAVKECAVAIRARGNK